MKEGFLRTFSPRRLQALDALRRARKLPVGGQRNDLRQLARGLLGLDRYEIGDVDWERVSHGSDAAYEDPRSTK